MYSRDFKKWDIVCVYTSIVLILVYFLSRLFLIFLKIGGILMSFTINSTVIKLQNLQGDIITKNISDRVLVEALEEIITKLKSPKNRFIEWLSEDVLILAKDMGIFLSDKEAEEILQSVIRKHDPEFGVTWEHFKTEIIDFYTNSKLIQ